MKVSQSIRQRLESFLSKKLIAVAVAVGLHLKDPIHFSDMAVVTILAVYIGGTALQNIAGSIGSFIGTSRSRGIAAPMDGDYVEDETVGAPAPPRHNQHAPRRPR